jgi:hypothetical protein
LAGQVLSVTLLSSIDLTVAAVVGEAHTIGRAPCVAAVVDTVVADLRAVDFTVAADSLTAGGLELAGIRAGECAGVETVALAALACEVLSVTLFAAIDLAVAADSLAAGGVELAGLRAGERAAVSALALAGLACKVLPLTLLGPIDLAVTAVLGVAHAIRRAPAITAVVDAVVADLLAVDFGVATDAFTADGVELAGLRAGERAAVEALALAGLAAKFEPLARLRRIELVIAAVLGDADASSAVEGAGIRAQQRSCLIAEPLAGLAA